MLKSDGITFSQDLASCAGNDATVLAEAQCKIPIATLITSPFDHPWGASIQVKVAAINVVGSSEYSAVGNGAVILTIPDAPLSLADDVLVTTKSQIGMTWYQGVNNGGTPVIDYRVW